MIIESNILSQLSTKELEWLEILRNNEGSIEDLVNRRDMWITENFITFMRLILKYGNLKSVTEFGTQQKKLVRIHRNILAKELEYNGHEYVIFNGLYIVVDVIFLEKKSYDSFFKKPLNCYIESCGIGDDVALNTTKLINLNDELVAVALTKCAFTKRYVEYQSQWSYPCW